jgi:predicted MFS family arabinose efflux permease
MDGAKQPTPLFGPGGAMVLGSSIVARLPLAMLGLGLLVHAEQLTGSFALAGLVSGAYAISGGLSAPLLGRAVDRSGQTRVLVGAATLTVLALMADALTSAGTPAVLLIAVAAVTGLATPPLEACVRTLLPALAVDPERRSALFALESTILELTFVAGPPLVLTLGALWSPAMALLAGGVMLLAGTVAFAAQPASRRWRNRAGPSSRPRGALLRSPAMRTLIGIMVGVSVAFGATEVGVTAAASALGSPAIAAPLLGLWGAGSLVGGIALTRAKVLGRRTPRVRRLLAGLALAHGALALCVASPWALAAVIVLAGATIAPTVAGVYERVDAAAPSGTETEAFAWLVTASFGGESLGNAAGGVAAQLGGAPAAFAFGGVAGGIALLVAIAGSARPAPAAPPRPAVAENG